MTGDTRIAPTVTLRNGAQMPVLGLGTWPFDDAGATRAVATAIENGYRLIDTAENYGNELGVGAGIKASGIPREELFITSKFNRNWHGRTLVREAFNQTTSRLGLDYLDLYMIHWPNPDQSRYVDAFLGLMDLFDAGLIKAIGLSNFKPAHIDRLIAEAGGAADVNQIQLSPYHPRAAERLDNAARNIITESWSPLGQGNELLTEPVITRIAARHDCTPAQAVLAWHLQLGCVTIPKSADPQRQRDNLAACAIALTDEDLADFATLERADTSDLLDSDNFGH